MSFSSMSRVTPPPIPPKNAMISSPSGSVAAVMGWLAGDEDSVQGVDASGEHVDLGIAWQIHFSFSLGRLRLNFARPVMAVSVRCRLSEIGVLPQNPFKHHPHLLADFGQQAQPIAMANGPRVRPPTTN